MCPHTLQAATRSLHFNSINADPSGLHRGRVGRTDGWLDFIACLPSAQFPPFRHADARLLAASAF